MPRGENKFINWVQSVNAGLQKHAPRATSVIRTLFQVPTESLEIEDVWTFKKHGPEYFVADKDAVESSTDIKWGSWFVG